MNLRQLIDRLSKIDLDKKVYLTMDDFYTYGKEGEDNPVILDHFWEPDEEEEPVCDGCDGTGRDDCAYCQGCGEGMHDGTRCTRCNGKGWVPCGVCQETKLLMRFIVDQISREE